MATLDMLTHGRFELGVYASWLEEEWEAVQWDFKTRGRAVDEALEVCRRLWSADEDVIEHHGEFWDFQPVKFNPKTTQQPTVPILVGGDGAAAKRRTVRFGTGWIPLNTPLQAMPKAIEELDLIASGRRPEGSHRGDGRRSPGRDGYTSADQLRRLEDAPRLGDEG